MTCDTNCMADDPCGAPVYRWGYKRKSETAVPDGKQCYYCRRVQRADASLAMFRVFWVRGCHMVCDYCDVPFVCDCFDASFRPIVSTMKPGRVQLLHLDRVGGRVR